MKRTDVIITILAMLGAGVSYAEGEAGSYKLTYTVAAIQGANRGILEVAGTVRINSDSQVSLRQGKPYLTLNIAGKRMFQSPLEQDLEFRKDNESHWFVEKGAGTARQFAGILDLIVSLHSIRTTGIPPSPRFMARDWNLNEQAHTAWNHYDSRGEKSVGMFILRDSAGNGVMLKPTGRNLQGLVIGSIGQFDRLMTLVANDPVDRAMLEKLITHSETDLLQIVMVTLMKE